jgi:hypothetical protein
MTTWVTLCRRTNDPKLTFIEGLLDAKGIPHRRHGESWHAPILEVPEEHEAVAWGLLGIVMHRDDQGKPITLDDIPDDDPMFCGEGQ